MFSYYAEQTYQVNSSFLEYPPVILCILDTPQERPMKFRTFDCLCLCLFVRSFSWEPFLGINLFLRLVRMSSNLKVVVGLLEQNLFLGILGQKDPKLVFSSFMKNQWVEFF